MKKNQGKKPIKILAETKHKKTKLTVEIETKLNEFSNIDNDIIQKSLNTSYKLLNQINSDTEIDFLIPLLENMKEASSNEELKGYIIALNAKFSKIIKPENAIVRKEIKEEKKIDTIRLKEILFEHRFSNKNIFFNLFYMFSLLTYTNDKNVIYRVSNLSNKALIDYVKKNYKFFSFDKMSLDTLYPLCGGKKKFYKQINEHINNLVNEKTINKFIDPFMGALGTFYSSYSVIKENDMSVVLNDLNPAIYCLNKQVKSKRASKKILKYISLFIQKSFQETNMFEPTYKDATIFVKRLEKILNYRAKKEGNKRSVLSSAILLFLLNNHFGGNYETKEDSSSSFSLPKDMVKFDRFFNFVGKVELYNFLYTSVNVKFENKDYKEVIKKHSRKKDTHTTFDPPYFEECLLSVADYEKQLKQLNIDLQNATKKREKNKIATAIKKISSNSPANYGIFGDNFPQEELLKNLSLIKGDISYFNYQHPLISKYGAEYGLNIGKLGRKSTNSKIEKGSEVKETFEVFMTGAITSNISNFRLNTSIPYKIEKKVA